MSLSSSSDSEDEEWKIIPIKTANRSNVYIPAPILMSECDKDSLRSSLQDAMDQLNDVLKSEGFWERYDKYFSTDDAFMIRGYGIGSPSNSSASCFQAALLILMKQRVKAKISYFFEPVMTETDRAVLEEYGIDTALRDNHSGEFSTKDCVIFYMPHCDRTLYEWVISNRFSGSGLKSFFISNAFSNYCVQYPQWERLVEFASEEPLFMFGKDFDRFLSGSRRTRSKTAERSSKIPYQAFNDLAFISLSPEIRQEASDIFNSLSQIG